MEHNQNASTPNPSDDGAFRHPPEGFSPPLEAAPPPDDLLGFEPVPLRYRRDGLTPEKQRQFVEALADCGVARAAAARIGVTEQSVARARRRPDARAFDLACEAAQRLGARQIRSVAWERAIEGTVKRHYYHGELKSEEIVHNDRLLIYLLGKTAHLAEPPAEAQAVVENWEAWMAALEQGLPEPPPPPAAEPESGSDVAEEEEEEEDNSWADDASLWEEDGCWWTEFPPPAGFDGEEIGTFGEEGYQRTLSEPEQAAVDERTAVDRADLLAEEAARRDRYFGFEGGICEGEEEGAEEDGEGDVFTSGEAEPYGTSEHSQAGRAGAPPDPNMSLTQPDDPPDPPPPRRGPSIRSL
jgi:hypothetical protein